MKLIAFIVLSRPCLSVSSHSGQQAFLLENVPCNNPSCQSVGRMFHIHWDQSDLGAIQNAVMATFFDFYEDVSRETQAQVLIIQSQNKINNNNKQKFQSHGLFRVDKEQVLKRLSAQVLH